MSLTQIFQEQVPEIFDFIKADYGVKFETIESKVYSKLLAFSERLNILPKGGRVCIY